MARRFSGMSYDYGGGGGGNYGYGYQAPEADSGGDDFAEGFASLAKVLVARRAEDQREKRSADIFYRQNTKNIPADKLREFEKEFDTDLDPKLTKTPEGRFAKAEHAIKRWNEYKQEVTNLNETLERNAAEVEAVRKAQQKTAADLTRDVVKQRSDALAERGREQKAEQTYTQRLATQARTTEAARRAAARAGLPPDSVVGPEAPDRAEKAMKSVPIYREGDEQGFDGVFEQIEIPKSDPRTWLSEEEAAQLRGGGGPATPTSPRPRQAESLVADAAAAPAPRTPAPQRRNAEQLREAATAPVAKPAQEAPARRPEAPPHAAPRTAQEIYENTTWNKAVTTAKKAVNEEEKRWTSATAADVHAADVLDEYVAWRDANGLPPLDERGERLAKTRFKTQLQGYGAGANRGIPVTPGMSMPGEPAFKSQQPFGMTAAEKNQIAEMAWDDPNRPYPGFYADRAARQAPAPIVAPKPKEPEGFFDRPITESISSMLGLRVPESAMPPVQSLANESRPGAVQPPPPESPAPLGMQPVGMLGVPTILGAPVRADDTMTPEELTQYREVQKEKEGLASLATFAATRVIKNGGTREQAIAAAEEAVTRQAANIEQQIATKQHMLAAPASRQIAAMIDENLTPRAAAKMAVQAAVMAAATYLTGGGALAVGGGAAIGNVVGQAALNKPGEGIDLRQAALEGTTVGLASKIPLGAIGRALGRGPVGTTVAGGVREGVQEMGEQAIQAGLEGRSATVPELATAGILGAVYGPVFEVAISAVPAPARANVQQAAAQAAQAGADAAQVAEAAAQAAQASGLTPEAVAAVQADVEAALAGEAPPAAAPAEPGSPAAPFGSPAAPVPVAPTTAEGLAAAAGEVEAARNVAATPAPPTRRGRRGPTAPATATEAAPTTEEAPTAPPAAPEGTPDFRAWVDQNLGGGTYAALEADFRATGDASQLTALRTAYQQGQTAGGDPISARALAQIESDPVSANALREQAARFEQERLAAARLAPPPTAPAAGHYAVMQGPDGQFYVATITEPDVTRREAEGEAGPRAGGRRAIMGPFRSPDSARTAASIMNERFTAQFGAMPEPGSLADVDPGAVLDWERKNAREVYRGAPREARAGGRNIGSGRATPSVLEPGTAARLKAEAEAATKGATARKARPPRKGRKPVKPPSTAIAAPAAAPLSGADAMLEGLRQQAKEAEAARAALPPGMAEEVTATEAALDDDAGVMADINAAVDRATSAEQLAGLLDISAEEAQTLLDGRDAESRGGTVAMADPFGAGLIQGILDKRAVAAADAVKQRLAERRALREAASPEVQATRERRRQLDADPDTLLREGKIVQGEILKSDAFRRNYGDNMPNDAREALAGYEKAAAEEAKKQPDPAKRRYRMVADEPEMKAWMTIGRARTLGGLTKQQFLAGERRNPRTASDPRNDPNMSQEELEIFFDKYSQSDLNGPLDPSTFDKLLIWTPDFGAMGLNGVVSQMGGPETTRRSRDMMRALDLAAQLGGRFEKSQSISPDTAKLYNNLWTMTGIPASRMAGMQISDIINHPGVRQFTERFKQREGRGNMPATADFLGLSQAFSAAQSAWNALTNAASSPGPKAGSVGRALLTGPRSTLEHLADLGPAGKAATGLFETYRDVKESLHGKWSSALDQAMGKVTEDQRSAYVDLLEGKPTAAKPETAQAAAETRAMLDEVARLASSNERFAGYIVDYFPRIMAERPSLARKAKAAALDMWQDPGHKKKMQALGITNWSDPAAASYAASQLMFPSGAQYGALAPNLEKHRTGLLQEYRTDPEVLYQYLAQASKAISHAMVFDSPRVTGPSQTTGKTMERYGGWKQLWGMLGANPNVDEDTLAGLRQALEREMGIEQAAPTTGSQIEQSIRDIVASTSLALSFTNQPLSFADTAATLGLGRSIGALSALKSQQAIDAAVRAGSIRSQNEAQGRSFAEENLLAQKSGVEGRLGAVAKAYRDMPWMDWMQGIDRAMRITADAATRASLADTVTNINAGDKATIALLKAAGVDPQSIATLTPQDVQAAMSYGQMSSPKAQRAVDILARRMVELTQQRGRPGDLPKSWSGAYGSWVSMFMPFKYRQMKSMLKVIDAKGLPAFLASGLPAYIALGGITAAMRAVLTGYGFRGEENEEQTTWEKFQSIFGNRPIKAVAGEDSPTDFLLRAAQTLIRAVPGPFAMAIAQRAERAKDAESLASTIMGPGFRVIQSGATALQGITGSGRPEDVGEAEWAARGLGAGAAQLLGPSAYSYQLKRELLGPEGNFPRKTLQPQASPGLVGRGLDLARGEITPGQFLKGVVVGGDDTLSERRKKRRANVKEDRRRRGKLKDEASRYERMRSTPVYE